MKKLFCCALVVTATLWSHTASSMELAYRGWNFGRQSHNSYNQTPRPNANKIANSQKPVHARSGSSRIQWLTDFDEASGRARREQKPMFVVFTGSDWCPWCMRLEDEVLKTTEFAREVGDKFVFVNIDFPRRNSQPQEMAQQNQQLKAQYAVKGFPTVLILDSQQRQIGTTGYRAGGPKAFVTHMDEVVGGY